MRIDQHKYRRRLPLVVYWQGNELVFENFVRKRKFTAEPLTCSILHYCGQWRTTEKICALLSEFSRSSVIKSLDQLCECGLLERSDQESNSEPCLSGWEPWNPVAGYLHFSTKDAPFAADQEEAFREVKRQASGNPMPLPLKKYPKTKPRTSLSHTETNGEFVNVLKGRRTWRKYGREAVDLSSLSTALELAFGIQSWVKAPGLGCAAMKTSPSCGCLHPIEAYVLAQRVKGLKSGLYHYNAGRHELEWLRGRLTEKTIERNLGHQWWFGKAAFLVVMTAVFKRTLWKYKSPRVYRGILIEAGHLCQTFCLTATWLGLAPFSTIAYTDTQWEKWLGIDGVNESVLYIAGAGTRPTDMKDAHMGTLAKAALE